MSTRTLQITVQVLGKKHPELENLTLQLPEDDALSLARLLSRIVQNQVADFNRKITQAPVNLPMLISSGKIHFGSVYNTTVADAEKAVADALQAFEDGLYFVFIDERKIERLEETVTLKPDSKLLFLRLTALTGGFF